MEGLVILSYLQQTVRSRDPDCLINAMDNLKWQLLKDRRKLACLALFYVFTWGN